MDNRKSDSFDGNLPLETLAYIPLANTSGILPLPVANVLQEEEIINKKEWVDGNEM